MRKSRIAGAAAALLLLSVSGASLRAAEPIPADARLVPDPAVHRGTLANGMRYAIMPNGAPSGAVSIRLLFNVGSYDEADDETGFAHFVEHMAFRSTRRAPGGVLDNRFAAYGVTLGQDHNAFTTLDSTIYKIDLPEPAPAGMRAVIEWLRDAADGIDFSTAAVDTERQVIAAEARQNDTPIARAQRATALFQAPELRSANRPPVGTPESIAGARPDALRAFHQRWYRPENTTLVIVGAIAPEEIARLAEEVFGDWTAKGAAPQRIAAPQSLRDRAPEAFVVADPSLPSALSACRLAPLDVERKPSLERLRRETLTSLWVLILNGRLQQRAMAPGSSLLGGLALANRQGIDARASCLVAVPADGRWKEALATVQAELRRFAEDGPTENEVTEATARTRGQGYGAVSEKGDRQTPTLADQLTAAELGGWIFESPEETSASIELVTAGVGADDIKAAFAHDWSGSGPLLSATLPRPVDSAEIVAAWQAGETAAPLDAYADREARSWDYKFGRKGKLRKRTAFPDPGFVRFDYANGVVVNFKQTDFAADTINIHLRLGQGLSAFAPDMRAPLSLGAGLLPAGGLGRLAADEIEGAVGVSNWEFAFAPDNHSWLISDAANKASFQHQMNLLAAFVTDPGFRPLIDEKMPTAVDMAFRMARTNPIAVAAEGFETALFPDGTTGPLEEQLLKWRAADFARVLKPILTDSPLEISIVGSIDEKRLRKVLATTFGALPPRPALAPTAVPDAFRRFPEKLPASVTAFHQGGPDKAAALLVWPLYVASASRRPEEYALYLLSAIFRDRLLQRVRVQMGKVYAPEVGTNMPDDADQGYLAASFEAAPSDLDALIAAAREVAQALAQGDVSEQELLEAREPLLALRRQALARNDAWVSVLSQSSRHPSALEELTRFEAQIGAVTREDVRRAAAAWLARPPMVSRALPGPAPASGPTSTRSAAADAPRPATRPGISR